MAGGTASLKLADRVYDWRATITLEIESSAAGGTLIAWAERTAAELAGERAGKPVLLCIDNPAEATLSETLTEHGFALAVAEDEMQRGTAGFAATLLGPGFVMRAWDDSTAPLFFRALNESFRERPGFPNWDEARWRASFEPESAFRADLSRVILDGAEPAAFATLWLEDGIGSIMQLGVQPPWRGKGLGEALLNHALGAFAGEGIETAALEVATNNPIARALYERMGFEVVGSYRSWRKELP